MVNGQDQKVTEWSEGQIPATTCHQRLEIGHNFFDVMSNVGFSHLKHQTGTVFSFLDPYLEADVQKYLHHFSLLSKTLFLLPPL